MIKIYIYLLLVFGIFATSCAEQKEKTELKADKTEYMIDINDEYYDIVYNENGYSLEDLDVFYRKIKETRKSDTNYNNLRKITINTMYLTKNLIGVEDKNILEFYTNEIISMPYISDMDMLYNMLANLTDYWGNEKVSKTATSLVKRNAKYINENFPDPQKINSQPQQKSGVQNMLNLMILD